MKINRATITNTLVYGFLILLTFIVLSCMYASKCFVFEKSKSQTDKFSNIITSIADINKTENEMLTKFIKDNEEGRTLEDTNTQNQNKSIVNDYIANIVHAQVKAINNGLLPE